MVEPTVPRRVEMEKAKVEEFLRKRKRESRRTRREGVLRVQEKLSMDDSELFSCCCLEIRQTSLELEVKQSSSRQQRVVLV